MDLALIIILLIRLIAPLAMFRWPLWGAFAAFIADGLDVLIWDLLPGADIPGSYHRLDKYPDMYYLSIMLIVSQTRWEPWPRRISLGLFGWRLLGFALFQATGVRQFLFFFPNAFEFFFVFVSAVYAYFAWYKLTPLRVGVWAATLVSFSLVREYFHHWQRVWDDLVATEVPQTVAEAVLSWLGDWFILLLAVITPTLAATWLLARTGRLGWLRRWLRAQLYMRGYEQEGD